MSKTNRLKIQGVIDFHVHITRRLDDCEAILNSAWRCGIETICVSSLGDEGYIHDPSPEQFRSANDYVLESMTRFPGEVIGFCYLNPNYPEESLEEIDRCVLKGGMRGIKLWIACKASDPKLDWIVERAIELDLPILQHSFDKATGNFPNESRPQDVAELAKKFPEAKIVMAHLHGNGRRGIAEIAELENVSVDLCGSDPEAGLLEYAVGEIGADRLLFGSDAPGRDFAVQMGKALGARITDDEKLKILSLNAARLLKIEPKDVAFPGQIRVSEAVDVNACLGRYPFRSLPYSTASELAELAKKHGISSVWVSSIEAIFEEDPRRWNERLLKETSRYPNLRPVAVINPAMANWRKAFDKTIRSEACAIKLHPNYHRYRLSSQRARDLLREAGSAGMPVIVQLRVQDERTQNPVMVVRDLDVKEVIEAAKGMRETKVIIGGIKWAELVTVASDIRALRNLWVDISLLERMNGLKSAVEMVGADKLLFGTHAPFCHIISAVLKVKTSEIGMEEKRRILIRNVDEIVRRSVKAKPS
jgi:hypothetical protein